MTSAARVFLQDDQLWLQGRVDFDNADAVLQSGRQLLSQLSMFPIAVNLSHLEQGSTLVLAIIMQWLRQLSQSDGLYLIHSPAKMQGILAASNLQHLVRVS